MPGDARAVIAGRAGSLALVALDDGHVVRTLPAHGCGINSVTVSTDSRQIATGADDGKLRLFDFESGKLLRAFDASEASAVQFTSDGRYLLSRGCDRTLIA